jgi:Transposase DDE domain
MGFDQPRGWLERVEGWLPDEARVLLLADRFYPSVGLLSWLKQARWHYRWRLKGSLTIDVGRGGIETVGELAAGGREGYEPQAWLFAAGVETNIGILPEEGHPELWIIALDCTPTKAAVRGYGLRWGIEPIFSDFKSRGFGLEDTQLHHPDRVERLIALMALAMYWCMRTGREEALANPTPTEKSP